MSLTHPLPERLKQARSRKDMSQQKLGESLGLDPNNASARMNQYERGKHTPDYTTLRRMAVILDVPVPFFYCEDDQDAAVIAAMHRLTPEQKTRVLLFIESLNGLSGPSSAD
jgi:transcriptional regulator with XRE-family HTH domain